MDRLWVRITLRCEDIQHRSHHFVVQYDPRINCDKALSTHTIALTSESKNVLYECNYCHHQLTNGLSDIGNAKKHTAITASCKSENEHDCFLHRDYEYNLKYRTTIKEFQLIKKQKTYIFS